MVKVIEESDGIPVLVDALKFFKDPPMIMSIYRILQKADCTFRNNIAPATAQQPTNQPWRMRSLCINLFPLDFHIPGANVIPSLCEQIMRESTDTEKCARSCMELLGTIWVPLIKGK